MRIFQFHECYQPYFEYFDEKYASSRNETFSTRLNRLLNHRFNAVHILDPAFGGSPDFAFTVANDVTLQQQWARERGLKTTDLTEILLAQIEEHRAEVVYNLAPIMFDTSFLRRLPSCVKVNICWRAAPMGRADLSGFDLRVCNSPNLIRRWEARGLRAKYFSPAHDPVTDRYALNQERPIDVVFVGSYSRDHLKRNRVLEAVAGLAKQCRVVLALTHPARRPLIDLPIIRRIPGPFSYLPKRLRGVAVEPVYGLEQYELFSQTKVVLNGAIDMAEEFRGNMRCFEALGCGACMLSDEGQYPEGFERGVNFEDYRDPDDMVAKLQSLLTDSERARQLAHYGNVLVREKYSKSQQWIEFTKLVADV